MHYGEESSALQREKQSAPQQSGPFKNNSAELKIQELNFLSLEDSNANFQLEASRLVQANCILTQMIKEAAIDKYTLSEKIHSVQEQIRKLEAKAMIK